MMMMMMHMYIMIYLLDLFSFFTFCFYQYNFFSNLDRHKNIFTRFTDGSEFIVSTEDFLCAN